MKDIKITSILYVIFGLIMLLLPGVIIDSFGLVIGAFCLFIGVSQIYAYNISNYNVSKNVNLVLGIVLILFGIYIFINPKFVTSIIPIIVGVLIIVNAFGKLSQLVLIKKSGFDINNINLIINIVFLILGCILIFNPLKSIELLLRIVGIILLIDGLYDYFLGNSQTIKRYKKVIKTVNVK